MSTDAPVRPRLLLVEDDPQLGPMIAQILEETYEVTLVADGAEGLSIGAEREPAPGSRR